MRASPPAHDRYGLPLTTTSAAATERYVEGVDRLLSSDAGAADGLRRAIGADPAFGVAHAALAIVDRHRGKRQEAAAGAARAAALAQTATRRERRHVEALGAVVAGDGARALRLIEAHLDEFPRDALLLSQATVLLSKHGAALDGPEDSGDPRARRLALHERVAPHYGDDWWFLGAHAFALNELSHHARARALVERSLALNPRNGNAAHAFAHVFYETGDDAGGATFLSGWLPGYDPRATFHAHNSWHLAVFELARGRFGRAMAVYERAVSPAAAQAGPPILLASDAAALLWRCRLAGYPESALPWGPVRDYVARTGTHPARALWDAYAALTFAGAGDREALDGLLERLGAADETYPLARPIVLPLARALGAFAAGAYGEAVRLMEPIAGDIVRLGGSNERRDVFEDTLIEANLQAGNHAAAEGLLRARLERRPSARDRFWLGRAQIGHGLAAAAAASLGRARELWRDADPDSPELAELRRLEAAAAGVAGGAVAADELLERGGRRPRRLGRDAGDEDEPGAGAQQPRYLARRGRLVRDERQRVHAHRAIERAGRQPRRREVTHLEADALREAEFGSTTGGLVARHLGQVDAFDHGARLAGDPQPRPAAPAPEVEVLVCRIVG